MLVQQLYTEDCLGAMGTSHRLATLKMVFSGAVTFDIHHFDRGFFPYVNNVAGLFCYIYPAQNKLCRIHIKIHQRLKLQFLGLSVADKTAIAGVLVFRLPPWHQGKLIRSSINLTVIQIISANKYNCIMV